MKRKIFQLSIFILLALTSQLRSQQPVATINGDGYPRPGALVRYEITFSQPRPEDQYSPISFTVYGGTIGDNSTSSVYGNPYLWVIWNSSATTGYIEVNGWAFGDRHIFFGEPLNPGTISCAFPFYNANNRQPMITSTPATDGTCNGMYVYTWEYSAGYGWDEMGYGEAYSNWISINSRTLIRRKVDCNGDIKYSNTLDISYRPSSWENRNFIVTTDVSWPGKMTVEDVDNSPIGHKQQSVVYYDGLSRAEQSIIVGISPDKKDIVSPMEYDNLGREVKKYMVYQSTTGDGLFKPNAITAQGVSLGDPVSGKYKGEAHFYIRTDLDNSPLNRVTGIYAPGANWGNSNVGIGTAYELNTLGEGVRIWRIDAFDPNAIPVSNAQDIYPDNMLTKTVVTDERQKKVIEYKDLEGQVILKKIQLAESAPELSGSHSGWLCTYFIYDDFGRRRFVLSPKAVEQIDGSWVITPSIADGLCFRYTYDAKGRMIEKKSPGAAVEYMVYDARDRLVLSQNGTQRAGRNNVNHYKEWSYYLYDAQNRQVSTGMMVENGSNTFSRADMQNTINNPAWQHGEKTFAVPSDIYEPVTTYNPVPLFPAAGQAIITYEVRTNSVNHYDETNAGSFTNADVGYPSNFENMEPVNASNRNRGLLTGTSVRILDDNGNSFLHTKNIYDDKARLLQTFGQNYLGHNVRITNQYDFSGSLRSENFTDWKSPGGGGTDMIKIITKFEQDHAARITNIIKNITKTYKYYVTDPETVIATGDKTVVGYKYDESGQLLSRTLSPGYNNPNGNNYLERLNYEYNVRGWMTGINKSYVSNSSSSGSFFGMELAYDKPGTAGFTNTTLNGNIAGMAWKTAGDNTPRKYDFTYDNTNRLISADFNQRNTTGAGWTKDKHDFSVPLIQFDANGNITRMNQQGVTFTGIVPMDRLRYQVGTTNNKLEWVAEDANADYKLSDFTDKNPGIGNVDYSYDESGNLLEDKNKGITSIRYNMLNLPELVTFDNNRGYIQYVYDAAGNKLRKRTSDNALGGGGPVINFSGPLTWQGDELLISTGDGRVRLSKTVTPNQPLVFAFDYYIKDHLGNVRMMLTEDTQTDFYPAASMEAATAVDEDKYYKIVNRTNKPDELQGQAADERYGQKMSRLSALSGGQKIGPSIVLKVMSGDVIHAKTDYYYRDNGPQSNVSTLLTDLATNLINHLLTGQAGTTAKAQATQIGANTELDAVVGSLITTQNNGYVSNRPKAFLNYIVFDEDFKAVSKGTAQVENNGAFQAPLVKGHIPIDKNGWIYVFVNNESEQPVYFDNFQVTHVRGNILEESHYYPYGLTMAAISTKALNSNLVENKIKFQGQEFAGKEFSDGSGLDMYEFKWRMHDPQTGRFWQIDPLADKYVYNSTYAFSENKVTAHFELEGLEAVDARSKNAANQVKVTKQNNQFRLTHDYNGSTRITHFNPSGEGKSSWGWKSIWGNRPNVSMLELGLSESEVNRDFSYTVASKNNIPEDYAEISVNGVGNTFRHLVLSSVMTAAFGESLAKSAGDMKEVSDMKGSNLSADQLTDLMNNSYGRQYAIDKGLTIPGIIESNESAANFLNNLAAYTLSSIEEYKNNPAYSGIISGKEKIYSPDSKAVSTFIFTLKRLYNENEDFIKK